MSLSCCFRFLFPTTVFKAMREPQASVQGLKRPPWFQTPSPVANGISLPTYYKYLCSGLCLVFNSFQMSVYRARVKLPIFAVCHEVNFELLKWPSPDNFKNAAFFLRLGLPSTLIRLEKTDLFENLHTSAGEQKNHSQARAIPLKNGFEVGRSVNTIFLSKLN